MRQIVSGISAVILTSSALAAIVFDPATGTGFVGKGDVQTAFGWNNAQLQSNAAGVSFSYDTSTAYDIVCEWDTETGGRNSKVIHHAVTLNRSTALNTAVTYEMRRNGQGQVTGFNLLAFEDSTTTGGSIPDVGDACLGETDNEKGVGNSAIVTEVIVDSTVGGLFVSYAGVDVLLQVP